MTNCRWDWGGQCRKDFTQHNSQFYEHFTNRGVSLISDEYQYLNIQIKCPSNIIFILIHAISGIQINLDISLVNTRHPNIFGYLFGT